MLVIRSIWVYNQATGETHYKRKVRINIPKTRFKQRTDKFKESVLTRYNDDCVMFLAYVEKGFKLKDKGYEK